MKNLIERIETLVEASLKTGQAVDSSKAIKSLRPGDKVTINGKPSTIFSVDSFGASLLHVPKGKKRYVVIDYRYAILGKDETSPETVIIFKGSGPAPKGAKLK